MALPRVIKTSLSGRSMGTEQTFCPKAFPRSHTMPPCSCLLARTWLPWPQMDGKEAGVGGHCCSEYAQLTNILFELVVSSLRKKGGILLGQALCHLQIKF